MHMVFIIEVCGSLLYLDTLLYSTLLYSTLTRMIHVLDADQAGVSDQRDQLGAHGGDVLPLLPPTGTGPPGCPRQQ